MNLEEKLNLEIIQVIEKNFKSKPKEEMTSTKQK